MKWYIVEYADGTRDQFNDVSMADALEYVLSTKDTRNIVSIYEDSDE